MINWYSSIKWGWPGCVIEKAEFLRESKSTSSFRGKLIPAHYIGITSVSIQSHAPWRKKTLEFEADSVSNNIVLNSRGHFALKNLGSGVHATISAIGNRKFRTRWTATKSVANALTTMGRKTVLDPFFPSLFQNFFHNAPYKI